MVRGWSFSVRSCAVTGNGINSYLTWQAVGRVPRTTCVSVAIARQSPTTTQKNCIIAWMMILIGKSTAWPNFWHPKFDIPHHAPCTNLLSFNSKFYYFIVLFYVGCPRTSKKICILVSLATVQGPLILLHGFHPGLLQICSMHVLNIGLMFDLNGCGLMLWLICCSFQYFPYASKGCFCHSRSHLVYITVFYVYLHLCVPPICTPNMCLNYEWICLQLAPRNCLLRVNYFGHAENASLQDQLNLAYDNFQAFCKSKKIYGSQPRFRHYMAPWGKSES